MLWIALYLPSLSLEAFVATLTPVQARLPMALVQDHRIAQANAAARALGVQPGLKRATALALAPDLLLGQADGWRDAQARQAVAHAALAFSPSVALCGASGVRLEVQASLRYFGGLDPLLQRLRAALQPLGHRLQLATAPTALGAALLARWRPEPPDSAPGPHRTEMAALRQCLDRAPVGLLVAASHAPATQRSTCEALQAMGLRQLADLRAQPRSGLARRFGPELLLALDRARGEAPEPHDWLQLPERFAARIELFTRADRSEQLMAGADILLARLVAWAQARRGRIARYTLVMHHEPGRRPDRGADDSEGGGADDDPERRGGHDTRHVGATGPSPGAASEQGWRATAGGTCTELSIPLAEPAIDARHLRQLLAERLARLPMPEPALELGLRCDEVVASEAPNGELFVNHSSRQLGLTRLVERLQARLGREQVCGLALMHDHRPERATVARPADARRAGPAAASRNTDGVGPAAAHHGTGGAGGAGTAADLPPLGPLHSNSTVTRPVWLLAPPQPLQDQAAHPLLDGQVLQLLAGPERIETGWWDGDLAVRDYFIAQTRDGALLWLYRTRLATATEDQAGWFLHGRFG